jgi:6-phosphogluconolactonase/glucosamine-6-phosphate isomerase/deaminase
MKIEIKKYSNKNVALKEASLCLSLIFKTYENDPILFLSSGGSCLGILNNDDIFCPINLTVGIVDERFTFELENQNFQRLKNSKFVKKNIEKITFLDQQINMGDEFENYTKKFKESIEEWLATHSEGKVIITLGMGVDGHTAGIFPNKNIQLFNELFNNPLNLVTGYFLDKKTSAFDKRISITNYFLKHFVDHTISYVAGAHKKNAFFRLKRDLEIHKMPFQVIKKMKNVKLFTDL